MVSWSWICVGCIPPRRIYYTRVRWVLPMRFWSPRALTLVFCSPFCSTAGSQRQTLGPRISRSRLSLQVHCRSIFCLWTVPCFALVGVAPLGPTRRILMLCKTRVFHLSTTSGSRTRRSPVHVWLTIFLFHFLFFIYFMFRRHRIIMSSYRSSSNN